MATLTNGDHTMYMNSIEMNYDTEQGNYMIIIDTHHWGQEVTVIPDSTPSVTKKYIGYTDEEIFDSVVSMIDSGMLYD